MYLELLPVVIGLLLTPAAIVGTILLLQSDHPLANAIAFGSGFLISYVVICALVLSVGRAADASGEGTIKYVVHLAVGVLFIAVGLVMMRRRPVPGTTPRWMQMLDDCRPRKAFVVGIVMSLVNPNLFILLSGLAIVATMHDGLGDEIGGTCLLLGAVALLFALPIAVYLVFGDEAKDRLLGAKGWMVRHDRPLTLGVLFGFGALFAVQGLVGLL